MKLYEKPFRMIVPNVKKRADRKTGEKTRTSQLQATDETI